jgi:hypothetical protein
MPSNVKRRSSPERLSAVSSDRPLGNAEISLKLIEAEFAVREYYSRTYGRDHDTRTRTNRGLHRVEVE